jgi:two-component system OmpR family sensor kinase
VLLAKAQVARMGAPSLERSQAFVELSERLLSRLGKLVESFLVLARADHAGSLPSESVAVIDTVVGAVQTCGLVAEQVGVRLVPNLGADPDELIVQGEPELLQTMLENLVHNAVSHSPAGGEVAIDARREGDQVSLTVRDHGPGIPAEYVEHVFDRFVRIPDSSARRDGAGLGLAIADGVARLHGGTIEARNEPDGGCSFVVHLPAAGD